MFETSTSILFITTTTVFILHLVYKFITYRPASTHQIQKEKPWWLASSSSEISLPSLSSTSAIVDLDVFDENCKKCIQEVVTINNKENRTTISEKKKIRIATKSVRCIHLIKRFIQLIQEADPEIFAGLLCFSAKELFQLVELELKKTSSTAVAPSSISFKHLLLAYPVCDTKSIDYLHAANALAQGKLQIATIVDSIEQVDALLDSSSSNNNNKNSKLSSAARINIWIDLDMSWQPFGIKSLHFGTRRSPIDTPEKVIELADKIMKQEQQYFALEGVQAYEGQVAGFPDVVLNSPIPFFIRRKLKTWCTSSKSFTERRTKVMKKLRTTVNDITFGVAAENETKKNNNITVRECNGGGSGSLRFSLADPAVTEVTVGSAALCGTQFDGYVDQPTFSPSLFFTLVATRRPSESIFTCHGGGWIASGDPGWNRLPKIVWPSGAKYLDFEGAGEVQTPIDVSGCDEADRRSIKIGDLFVFRPNKSGEMGEVFSEYVLVSKKNSERKVVKTYRGDGLARGCNAIF